FYFSGQEYAAESGLLKPLLHTWSLSVEEQFYIIFPIIILTINNFKKINIFTFIFLFSLISIFFAEYLSEKNEMLNFYTLPSRAWELLLGTLIATLELKKIKSKSILLSELFVLLGLIIIILSFIFFDESIAHPTYRSLPPVLGTLLILYFAQSKGIIVKFLSFKSFSYFGLISYSLYLWHFPIFALAKYGFFINSNIDYIVLGFSLIMISIFSYHFIEKPFRSSKFSLKFYLISIIFAYLSLFVISTLVINNNGFKHRFPDIGKFSLDNQQYIKERRFFEKKIGTPAFKINSKKNVLIVGNSHGQDLFHSIYLNKNLFPDYQFSKITIDNLFCFEEFLDNNKICGIYASKKIQNIFNLSNIILIAPSYGENDKIFQKMDKIILQLKKSKKKVILVSQMPNFYFENNRTSIDQFYFTNNRMPNTSELSKLEREKFKLVPSSVDKIDHILNVIAKRNNIEFLNRKNLICKIHDQTCFILTDNDEKINIDSDHLSIAGAKFIGNRIFDLNWLNLN
ncbi:acyltransferase, partial [Pelagibacteraceae bacterium]|nr:acyltransferase [Pelagibacteraceae bacterium]